MRWHNRCLLVRERSRASAKNERCARARPPIPPIFPAHSRETTAHTFKGRPTGVVVTLKSQRLIGFPLNATLENLYGYRADRSSRGNACAILAPGQLLNKSAIHINDFHCATGHSHGPTTQDREAAKKSSSRGRCWSAGGGPWQRVFTRALSSSSTYEQTRSSGELLWI